MIRTQIYLTREEGRLIALLARVQGKTKSEIIRGILDEKLAPGAHPVALAAARKALGAWRGAGAAHLRWLRSRW